MKHEEMIEKIEAAKNNFAEGKKRPTEAHYRAFYSRKEFLNIHNKIQEINYDCQYDDHTEKEIAEIIEMIDSVFEMTKKLSTKYTPEEIYMGIMLPADVKMTDSGPAWEANLKGANLREAKLRCADLWCE